MARVRRLRRTGGWAGSSADARHLVRAANVELLQDVVGALGETSDKAPAVGAGVGAWAEASVLTTFEAALQAAKMRRGGALLGPRGERGAAGRAQGLHGQHAASCMA